MMLAALPEQGADHTAPLGAGKVDDADEAAAAGLGPAAVLPGFEAMSGAPGGPGLHSGSAAVPGHVTRRLVTGTTAMGAGALIERGLGFLANILAARLGGASTFGAYSLGITTAANISTYAAGGIGSTAARFSGKYPQGSPGYPALARALAIVSVTSAAVAAAALWFGAGPLAHILAKPSFAPMLRWAAFSSAGMILLECARGFFIGQRRLVALLLLSLAVGAGMVTLIPFAATHHSPAQMILSQAGITTGAVIVCLSLAAPLGLLVRGISGAGGAVGPILREVWGFGMVTLAGLVGMNLAGWWLTTLVARADTTLVEMSFFAIANQMRNIVGLAPSLLTETSYAIMAASDRVEETAGSKITTGAAPAEPENGTSRPAPDRTPDQVMALCTWFATASSLALSSIGMVVAPWALTLVYGHAYRGGALTAAVALAIAIVHMGASPAAARLTILSIRTSGAINTAWAAFVAGVGTLVLLHGGSAWQAMAVYLGAHLLSSSLVIAALARHGSTPVGMVAVLALGAGTATGLAVMAYLREVYPWLGLALTFAMVVLVAAGFSALIALGRRHGWAPRASAVWQLLASAARRLRPASEVA